MGAKGIKIDLQMGDDPRLSWWVQFNHESP